jgi:hypothetical protein
VHTCHPRHHALQVGASGREEVSPTGGLIIGLLFERRQSKAGPAFREEG